jgi:hypothetical protein
MPYGPNILLPRLSGSDAGRILTDCVISYDIASLWLGSQPQRKSAGSIEVVAFGSQRAFHWAH